MKTYTSTRTSQLKSGMTVHMHGSEFKITSDPVMRSNANGDYYLVGCEIIEQLPKGDYMEMLNDFKVIQSNDLTTYGVMNN
jgi:hypothetical protein